MNRGQKYLLFAASGVLAVALTYGVNPKFMLNFLYGMTVSGTDQTHIYRAVMGLYLGFVALWIGGALRSSLYQPAMTSLVVFMFGIAIGRAISLAVDGMPHWLFVGYLALEIILGSIALYLFQVSQAKPK